MAETPPERIGLHNLKPAPGSRKARKRIGRGEGSGTGKTSGRGQKGWGSRSGAKRRARFEGGQNPIHMRMRKLRGPHMKKSMPFEPFRTHTQPVNLDDLEARFETGAAVTLEAMKAKGLATRKGIPVKVLAKGSVSKPLTVHAHGFSKSAREQIEAAGGTCQVIATERPAERARAMVSTILGAFRVAEIRKKILFTAGALALYRLGTHIPAPGINAAAVKQIQSNFGGSSILGLLNLFSGGGLGRIAIFALGIMPYITASIILQLLQVVVPSLEKLSKEGEVGQARITQYTRYLTVGLAFAQSIGYVFLFRSFEKQAGQTLIPNFNLAKVFLIVISLTAGTRAADVDGRADHPARHRQRHLAADLRQHRLPDPERRPVLVDQPRSGLPGRDAVHRRRRGRGDRVRPGGPAPDPDPVRQTGDRPTNDPGRPDLPAAAGQHGRRDPGDLRRQRDGDPADDRAADRPEPATTSPPTSPPSSTRRAGTTCSARAS